MLPDGDGLYVQVSSTRSKSWIFRFTLRGKHHEMGLGSVKTFSLAEARGRAQEARKLVAVGAETQSSPGAQPGRKLPWLWRLPKPS